MQKSEEKILSQLTAQNRMLLINGSSTKLLKCLKIKKKAGSIMDHSPAKTLNPCLPEMTEPFNDPDWIFELKLDGIRCIAYLDKMDND